MRLGIKEVKGFLKDVAIGLFILGLLINDIAFLLLLFFVGDDYQFGVVEWTMAFFFALSLFLFLSDVEEKTKGGK